MLKQAVTFFLQYEDAEMDEVEFLEVTAAVEKGLAQAARCKARAEAERTRGLVDGTPVTFHQLAYGCLVGFQVE